MLLSILKLTIQTLLRQFMTRRFFHLTMPITFEEEIVGYIYQQSNFDQLDAFKEQLLLIVMLVFAVCLTLAVFIAYRFQRVLLNPLFRLVDFTREVIKSKDYSLRVESSQ